MKRYKIIVIISILFFVVISVSKGGDYRRPPFWKTQKVVTKTQWLVKMGPKKTVYSFTGTELRNPKNEKALLEMQFHHREFRQPCLILKTSRQRVDIYVGEEKIYQYPEKRWKGKIFWDDLLFISLPDSISEKNLIIQLEQEFNEGRIPLKYAVVGERQYLTEAFLLGACLQSLLGLLLIIMGTNIVVFILGELIKQDVFDRAQLYLGLWILSLGFWYLFENHLLYNFFGTPVVIYLCKLFVSSAIPVFIFAFLYYYFEFLCKKIFLYLAYFQLVVMVGIFQTGIFSDMVLGMGQRIQGLATIITSSISIAALITEIIHNVRLRYISCLVLLLFVINLGNAAGHLLICFSESWFITFAVLLILLWLFRNSLSKVYHLRREAKEKEMLQKHMGRQLVHYEALSELSEKRWILYHDVRHHLRTIRGLYNQGKRKEGTAYLEKMFGVYEKEEGFIDTGNPVLDAIIEEQKRIAQKEGIEFILTLKIGMNLPVQPLDWCIIMSNALENAIMASKEIRGGKRTIELILRQQENMLFMRITNPVPHNYLNKRADQFLHGFGLKSIRQCVANYNGTVETEIVGTQFLLTVILFDLKEKEGTDS